MTLHIIDVGSRGGLDPRWDCVSDAIRVTAIDADPDAPVPERAYDVEVKAVAVADVSREATLYFTREPGCSSLFRPNRAVLDRFPNASRMDVMREIPLQTQALSALGLSADFMKLDTQGTELDILRGAALDSVIGVEVEIEFVPLYQGQPLFGSVDQYLTSQGFVLADIKRVYWKSLAGTWHLTSGDALYLRDRSTLSAAQASKADIIDRVYGYQPKMFVPGAGRIARWIRSFTHAGMYDADWSLGRR